MKGTRDYLSHEQQNVKDMIVEKMLDTFFSTIKENLTLLDIESTLKLIFTTLIVVNSEILIHTFNTFLLQHHRKQLMKDLFEQIRDEVNDCIKRSLM